MSQKAKHTYAAAGVDIETADSIKMLLKQYTKGTLRPEVLAGPGLFGGLFELRGYKHPVLVSSVDGVGTKLKIAESLDKYSTVGVDIVNHCVNDILTCGADPLFFLDYIAMGKLIPEKVATIVKGMSAACQEVGCALIGGETAEMPGIYATDDYDLVGFIIGAVEKENIISGKLIATDDVIIGIPSSGLHTNGYSLARRIFGDTRASLNKYLPGLGKTIGELLLEPHTNYYGKLKPVLPVVKGMAHITGGGLIGNIPRILPEGLAAQLDVKSWSVPPIFHLIQNNGHIDTKEMYRVFNMGIGMVVFCSRDEVKEILNKLPEAMVIGNMIKQTTKERVIMR
ncbi:MAG: phosphoribosylformylglycinamidine cyclo-ligase [Dehalococcoidia bacterium]|nr:MAG: phosphoribosylformylglycinamidine cyclo-ligase [Dehalococcoidia bacterium]